MSVIRSARFLIISYRIIMSDILWQAKDEAAMLTLGLILSQSITKAPGGVIYLQGTLGMGKTTLSRAIIQSMGWAGPVKSPTYTLVESYSTGSIDVNHFDLYRLADPEELEYIGFNDFLGDQSINLIEWPEQGEGVLPPADLKIMIEDDNPGRIIRLSPQSEKGEKWCQQCTQ